MRRSLRIPLAGLPLIGIVTTAAAIARLDANEREVAVILLAGAVAFAALSAWVFVLGMHELRLLDRVSATDGLTGLPNRRALHQAMAREAAAGKDIALALADLDGFKAINDHYGHNVGDAALCRAAVAFEEVIAGEAQLFRLSGDEYAVMLSGPVAATLLEGICRRIIDRLGKPLEVGDRRLTVGASIGLSRAEAGDMPTSSELLRRADVAMSASKRAGRSRCTWFTEAFDQTREQTRQLDGELRQALARKEFALHYQPLVDAHTQHVVAVECLLRWNRPDGRAVGPHIFVPVAEESGLINAIGLWVLRRACRDACGWADITLSVNISAAQLRNPEFPFQLGQILEETGFNPERLELEITETCLVLDPVVAERSLALIRGFGVRIALDDFGTGYASIGFLRQFRFEKLKLDRSLVVDAECDAASRAMMLSSITVARAMNMGVTAEGVETVSQADMVRAAGCDQIQGWLYFRALPAAEVAQHLGRPVGIASSRAA